MMHRFLRYEIAYSQIYVDPAQAGVRISFEDVLSALRRIDSEKIPMLKVLNEWMDPLYSIGDEIGLPDALGFENTSTADILLDEIIGRSPLNRENTMYHVLGYMWHAPQMFSDDASFFHEVHDWLEMMENTLWNEERPMYEWKLTAMQKMHYVMDLFQNEMIDLTDGAHQELFRRSLDELCEEGIYDALKIKAFCCMDGNTVYDRDVRLASEYFEACAREDEDPMAANALADLYLQGDLNDGIPQYDLAYKYYSVAAFSGVYESILRCADLLLDGHGVPRNAMAAYNQILYVYTHTKQQFTEGVYSIAFADAAVRMGDCWMNGIPGEPDVKLAYSYYLDAETAIRMRMRYDKCRGDDALYRRIQTAVHKTASLLGDECMQKESDMPEPLLIDRMLSGGFPLRMRCRRTEDGMDLIFSRVEPAAADYILLTVEGMSSSALKKEVLLHAQGCEDLAEDTDIIFSAVGFDYLAKRTYLYDQKNEVCAFTCSSFILKDDRPENWTDQPLAAYVNVQLNDGTRCEYRSDVPGLKRGDRVAVPSVYGELEGKVVTVFRARPYQVPEITDDMHVLRKLSLHLMA